MFESIGGPKGTNWKLRIVCAALTVALVVVLAWLLTQMPLRSFKGPLPPLSREQSDLAERLSADVKYLSVTIGEGSIPRTGSLEATSEYLHGNRKQSGYSAVEETYSVAGKEVNNVYASLIGSDPASGTIIVGAHYDSVAEAVGANGNASGVAATLELARLLQGSKLRRTLRFVFFVNEEPPYFQTNDMGSLVYARQLRHDNVVEGVRRVVESLASEP